MRAELKASLCSPKESPVSLQLDPTQLTVGLSGKPQVSLPPLEVQLPNIDVGLPDVTLNLPSPSLHLEVGLSNPLKDLVDTIAAGVAAGDPIWIAISLAAITNPAVLLGLLAVQPPPRLTVDADVTLGTAKLTLSKGVTVDLDRLAVHGVPTTGSRQPVSVALDLDDANVAASLDAIRAVLQGCLVLNGGEPESSTPPPPPPPPPPIENVEIEYVPEKKQIIFTIFGSGFGPTQGTGRVELRGASVVYLPDSYPQWTDTRVKAIFAHAMSPGAYALVVVNSAGGVSSAHPVSIT